MDRLARVVGYAVMIGAVVVVVATAIAYGFGMILYYGSGIQIGPVHLDWYYLIHGGNEWWFPGNETY